MAAGGHSARTRALSTVPFVVTLLRVGGRGTIVLIVLAGTDTALCVTECEVSQVVVTAITATRGTTSQMARAV
jgi:hypothetical protein